MVAISKIIRGERQGTLLRSQQVNIVMLIVRYYLYLLYNLIQF